MSHHILMTLRRLETDYYAGVSYRRLSRRILDLGRSIEALGADDPMRRACEEFAPALWGEVSRSRLDADELRSALESRNAAEYLRAWAHFWRIAETYRLAA